LNCPPPSCARRYRAGTDRHAQHIAAIRGKAESENTKVSEVNFINVLNADGIKKGLDARLREVGTIAVM